MNTTHPQITAFVKFGGHLSKAITLNKDGSLNKDPSQCVMSEGHGYRHDLCKGGDPSIALAELIQTFKPYNALALGRLPVGVDAFIGIVAKGMERLLPAGPITRSARNITYMPGVRAFMLCDVDTKGASDALKGRLVKGEIEAIIAEVLPAISTTSRMARASTSAGLYIEATGEPVGDAGGSHLYLLVTDGADIPRALAALAQRLWLAGYGWIALAKNGGLHIRQPVDVMVAGAERLVFEGGPVLGPGLAQDMEARRPRAYPGAALDTRSAIPDLTADELARYVALVTAAKEAIRPAAEKVAAEYHEGEVEKLVRRGVSPEQARATVASRSGGTLTGADVIEFSDGTTATVADILADPKRFHRKPCADPIEGRAYGSGTAIVYSDQAVPVVSSFAHGGAVYRLVDDAEPVVDFTELMDRLREAADPLDDALGGAQLPNGLLDTAAHFIPPDMDAPYAGTKLKAAIVEFFDGVELAKRVDLAIAAGMAAAGEVAAREASALGEAVAAELGDVTDADIYREIMRRAKIRVQGRALEDADLDEAEARVSKKLVERARGDVVRAAYAAHGVDRKPDLKRLQLKAAAGLGKTSLVVAELNGRTWMRENLFVEIYVPRHDLADDIARQLTGARVMRGRKYGRDPYCARVNAANKIAESGLPVFESICRNSKGQCPFYDECQWIAQWLDHDPGIRIMTHNFIVLPKPLGLPKADLVIIDESCFSVCTVHPEFAPCRITNSVMRGGVGSSLEYRDVAMKVYESIQANGGELAKARELGLTGAALLKAATYVENGDDAPILGPRMEDDEIIKRVDALRLPS